MPKEQLPIDPEDDSDQSDEVAPTSLYEDDEDDDAGQPYQAPKLVRVRMHGRTVEMTEEAALAFEEHEAERQKTISRMGTELGSLRKQTPAEPIPAASDADDDLEFFQSPSKTMAKHLAAAEERAAQRIQAELDRKDAVKSYWTKFYSVNKDLVEHEEVVQFLVSKHFEDLKDLSPVESQREIATKARTFLGKPAAAAKALPKGEARTERPSHPAPAGRPQPAEQTPQPRYKGLSAELAKMAERRRKALYSSPKDEK